MKSWPGPVVIYITDIEGENNAVDEWRHIVGPNGKTLPNLQTWADLMASS